MRHDFLNCERREVIVEMVMIILKLLSVLLSLRKIYPEYFWYQKIPFHSHILNMVTLNE